MTDTSEKLKRIERNTWRFTKRTLIGSAVVIVILIVLLIAFSAAP